MISFWSRKKRKKEKGGTGDAPIPEGLLRTSLSPLRGVVVVPKVVVVRVVKGREEGI